MKKVQLVLNGFALLAVYVVASAALNEAPEGMSSFLERLGTPFLEITPLGAGILAAATFAFAVSILAAPSLDLVGPSISWTQLIQVAFVVNTAVLAGIAAALFLGHTFPRQPHAVGVLFLIGICEAALGMVLAATHFFIKRPRIVFLPTLGVHLLSLAALGAAYVLGSGTTP
jgi:hypothetical protein